MDIPVKDFISGSFYEKNDIVRVGPLFKEDLTFTGTMLGNDGPVSGEKFQINGTTDLVITSYYEKDFNGGGFPQTVSRNRGETFFRDDRYVNILDSKGVGLKVAFYHDKGAAATTEIPVADSRTHFLLGSSQIPSGSARLVKFIIPTEIIPAGTRAARVCAVAYDSDGNGTFDFPSSRANNESEYFYCTDDNQAGGDCLPNGLSGAYYWTQKFNWTPSYGSQVSFKVNYSKAQMGDGVEVLHNQGINSLQMDFKGQFNGRTDKEARAITHFLKEKHFTTDSEYYKDSEGNPLESAYVPYFKFTPPVPYDREMRVICNNFNQEQSFRNINALTASFINDRESILYNNATHNYVNTNLDIVFGLNLDPGKKLTFYKGIEKGLTITKANLPDDRCNTVTKNLPNGERRKIYLDDYNYFYLAEDLSPEDGLQFNAVSDVDFTYSTNLTFTEVIVANPCYRSSMFMDPVSSLQYFPYLRTRTLEHKPSFAVDFPHAPRIQESKVSPSYKTRKKDGLHTDMVRPTFKYENRSDEEAKSLLYFVESHLGVKPFRYLIDEPYEASYFNCAGWDHTFTYKNNHNINLNLSKSEVSPVMALPEPILNQYQSGLFFDNDIKTFHYCPEGAQTCGPTEDYGKNNLYIYNDSSFPSTIKSISITVTGTGSDNEAFVLFDTQYFQSGIHYYDHSSSPAYFPIELEPEGNINIPLYFSGTGGKVGEEDESRGNSYMATGVVAYNSLSGLIQKEFMLSGELVCPSLNTTGIIVSLTQETIKESQDFGFNVFLSGTLANVSGNVYAQWGHQKLGASELVISKEGTNELSMTATEAGLYSLFVTSDNGCTGQSVVMRVESPKRIIDASSVSYLGFSGFNPASFFMGAEGINLELAEFYPNLGITGIALPNPILADTDKKSLPIWTDGGITDFEKLGGISGPRVESRQFIELFTTDEKKDTRGILQIPSQAYAKKKSDLIAAGEEEFFAEATAREGLWEEVYVDIFAIGVNEDNQELDSANLDFETLDQKGCGEIESKPLFVDGKLINSNDLFCDFGDGEIEEETVSYLDYYPTLEQADEAQPGYLLHNVDSAVDPVDGALKYKLTSFYKRFNENGYGYRMVAKAVPISVLREIDSDSVPSFFQSYFARKSENTGGEALESYLGLALDESKANSGGNTARQLMHEAEVYSNCSPFSTNRRESFYFTPRGCGFFSIGSSLQFMEKYFRQSSTNPFAFNIPNGLISPQAVDFQGVPKNQGASQSFFYYIYTAAKISETLKSINSDYMKFVDRMRFKFSSFLMHSNNLITKFDPISIFALPLQITTRNTQNLTFYYSRLFNKFLTLTEAEYNQTRVDPSFYFSDRIISCNFRNFTDIYAFSKPFRLYTSVNKLDYNLAFGRVISSQEIPGDKALKSFAESLLNTSPTYQVGFHPTEKLMINNLKLDNEELYGVIKQSKPANPNHPAILQYAALSFNNIKNFIDFPKYIQQARRSNGGYGDYVSPIGWHNYQYRAKALYNYLTGTPTGSFEHIAQAQDYEVSLPSPYQFGRVLGINLEGVSQKNTTASYIQDSQTDTRFDGIQTPLVIYRNQPYYALGVERSGLNTGLLGNTGAGGVLDPMNDYFARKFMVKPEEPSFPVFPWAIQCYANEDDVGTLPTNLVDYMSLDKISGLSYQVFPTVDTGVHEVFGKTGDSFGYEYGGNDVKNILELNYYNPQNKSWTDFRGHNSYRNYATQIGVSEDGLIFPRNGADDVFAPGVNVSALGNINTGSGSTIGFPETLTVASPTGGENWQTFNVDPGKIRNLGPTYDFLFEGLRENVRRRLENGETLQDPLSIKFLDNVGYYLTKKINNASEGNLSKNTKYSVNGISDYPLTCPSTYGIFNVANDDKKSPNIFMRIYGRKVVDGRLVELYRGDVSKKSEKQKIIGGGSFGFPSDVGYPRVTENISGVIAAGDYVGVLDTNEVLRIYNSPHRDEVALTNGWNERGLKVKAFDMRKNSMASLHQTNERDSDGINWESNNTLSVVAFVEDGNANQYLTGAGISGFNFSNYQTHISGVKQLSLGTHHFLAVFGTGGITGVTGFGNNSSLNAGALNDIYPDNTHTNDIKNVCAGNYCSYITDLSGNINLIGNTGKNENGSFPSGSGFNRVKYYTSPGFNDIREFTNSGISGIDERIGGGHCYVGIKDDRRSIYWWGGAAQSTEQLFKGFKGPNNQNYFKFVKSKTGLLYEDFTGFSSGAAVVYRNVNFANTGSIINYNEYVAEEDIMSVSCDGAEPTIAFTGNVNQFYGYNAYLSNSGETQKVGLPIGIVKTLPSRSVSYSDQKTGYSNFENTLIEGGPDVIFNTGINLGGIIIDTTIPKVVESGISTYYNQCLRYLIHRLDAQKQGAPSELTNNIDIGIPLGWQTNPLRTRLERLNSSPLVDINQGFKGSAINFVEDLNENAGLSVSSLQEMENLGAAQLGKPVLSTFKSINNNVIYPLGETYYPVSPKEIGNTDVLLYDKILTESSTASTKSRIKAIGFDYMKDTVDNKEFSQFGNLLSTSLYQYGSGLSTQSKTFVESSAGDFYKYSFDYAKKFEMVCPLASGSGILENIGGIADSADRSALGMGGAVALPNLNYVTGCTFSGVSESTGYFQTGYQRDGEYKSYLIPKRIDGFLGTMRRYYGAFAYEYLTGNKLLEENVDYTSSLTQEGIYRQNASFYTLAKSGLKEGYLFNIKDSGDKVGKENFDITFKDIDGANVNKNYRESEELYNDLFLYDIEREGGFTYSNMLNATKSYTLKTFGLIPNSLSDYKIEDFYKAITDNIATGFSPARIIENFPGKELTAQDSVRRTGQATYADEHVETLPLHNVIFTGSVSGNYAPATINPESNLSLVALEGLYEADSNEFAAVEIETRSRYDGYDENNLYQSIKSSGIFWDNPTFIANNQRTFLSDSNSFPFMDGFSISHIHNFLIALEPKKYYPSVEIANFADQTFKAQVLTYDPSSASYVMTTDEDEFNFDPTEIDLEKFQQTKMLEQLDTKYKSPLYSETNSTISSLSSVPFFIKKTALDLATSITNKAQNWTYTPYESNDLFHKAPRPTGSNDSRFITITPLDGTNYGKIITDAPSNQTSRISLRNFSNQFSPVSGNAIAPSTTLGPNQLYPATTTHTRFYRVIMPNFTADKLNISYAVGNPDDVGGPTFCNTKFNYIDGATPNPIYFQIYVNGSPVLSKAFIEYAEAERGTLTVLRSELFDSAPLAGPIKVWIDICPNNHPYNATSYGGYSALNCSTLTSAFSEFNYNTDNCFKIKMDQE